MNLSDSGSLPCMQLTCHVKLVSLTNSWRTLVSVEHGSSSMQSQLQIAKGPGDSFAIAPNLQFEGDEAGRAETALSLPCPRPLNLLVGPGLEASRHAKRSR